MIRYFALLIFIFLIGCETTKTVTKSTKVSVNEIIENRKIEKNFTKKQLKDALGLRYMLDNPFTKAGKSHRVLEHDAEIISGANQNIFYVFKYVSEPLECGLIKCNLGNGALVSWHSNFEDALNSLGKKELTQTEKLNQMVTKSKSSKNKKSSSSKTSSSYDSEKYTICYGEMTIAHKKRGFHDRNRLASISVKETVCEAYAKGEINNYEGKN